MKASLIFFGPLVAIIGFGFYSGLLDFADKIDGFEHTAGVEPGGTFALQHEETYQCDENGDNCILVDTKTEFSEIEGLEFENSPIEYRDGSENIAVRKLNGIKKYTNVTLRRPSGFNWKKFKFTFNNCSDCGPEMRQVDPPTLVVPAQ
jgi:hypothetical protein